MKRSLHTGRHMVDLLFTLALFCVFASSSLMVVLIGANVYKNTAQGMEKNFSCRTCLAYITQKVRQNDTAGSVRLDSVEGAQALVLTRQLEGADYETWIYCDEGALKEVFVKSGASVKRSDGQSIVETAGFSMERLPGGLLRFTASGPAGGSASVAVLPRCAVTGP